jgi:23S rRNA pseudouridine955/2504/2580 synthase
MRRIKPADEGMRLDRWIKANFPTLPHSLLQKLLRTGQVRVNGGRAKPDRRLEAGDEIKVRHLVTSSADGQAAERKPSLTPPPGLSKADRDFIERMILFEDEELMVLNKPFGIAVQGGTRTRRHIDGILAGMEDRFGDRPRLVHRLDRDTSGVLLVAKTRQAASRFGKLFQTRSVHKIYWGLLKGIPKPPQGKIDAALVKASGPDGDRVRKARPGEQETAQSAVTHYSVIEKVGSRLSWVSLKPVTGRQHQLRAHMAILGTPIIGDQKYEGDRNLPVEGLEMKLHLHARRLILPRGKGAPLDISAPLPDHMMKSWGLLGLDPERFDDETESL